MVYIPQPLRSRREAFVSRDYLFELKMDGFRALAVVESGRCDLYSRNGSKFSGFRFLAEDIAASIPLTRRAILDGEIVCLDENGYPQFEDLLFQRAEPCFFAFDLLSLEGHDLRRNALIERKAELRRLLTTVSLASRMRYADHVEGNGIGLFELVCDRDLEGIVAKLKHGPYVHQREESTWLKIRNMDYSQQVGREELFERDRRSEPTAGWHACAVACEAVERRQYKEPCELRY
jgi:bifunctional non-homologous end joining protein LigD